MEIVYFIWHSALILLGAALAVGLGYVFETLKKHWQEEARKLERASTADLIAREQALNERGDA